MPIVRLPIPGEIQVAMLSTTTEPSPPASSSSIGVSTYAARADHVHPEQTFSAEAILSITNPLPLGTASAGTSTKAAREDHVHPGVDLVLSDDIPSGSGTAAPGTSDEPSRSDHIHPHGDYNNLSNKPSLSFVGLSGNETIGGTKTFSEVIIPSSTKGIKGTTTNDNAIAGSIGEEIRSQIAFANRQALTNGAIKDITSIALTGGHWNIIAQGYFDADASSVVNRVALSIGEAAATFNVDNGLWQVYPSNLTLGSTGVFYSNSFLSLPYKKTAAFTLYFGVLCGFSSGAVRGYGSIVATRVR